MASSGGARTMRTFAQSASSSSAMISGSEVIDPCPISVAADMMVTVPSVAMLIHGLITWPVRASASTAASSGRMVKANESPATPSISWRRVKSVLLRGLFMSRLPCGPLDRPHDTLIGAATADVRAHVLDDLRPRRLRILREKLGRAHDLAGLAVAALRYALGEPRLLHRVTGIGRQAFDRGHRLAGDLRDLRLAREGALAVDVHHAGAAQAGAAAEFRAGELEFLADDPQQGRCRRCVGICGFAIDLELD